MPVLPAVLPLLFCCRGSQVYLAVFALTNALDEMTSEAVRAKLLSPFEWQEGKRAGATQLAVQEQQGGFAPCLQQCTMSMGLQLASSQKRGKKKKKKNCFLFCSCFAFEVCSQGCPL